MSRISKTLEELQNILDKGVNAEAYSLLGQIKEYDLTKEEQEEFDAFMEKNIKSLSGEIDLMHETAVKLRLGELGDMINLAYVAKKYFNKSRAWLSQRINGNYVNGKPVRFTEVELAVFNSALSDMSKILGSQRLSY